MKIPNKRELQEPYKKSTVETYSFLVIATTLPSDNSSCFRNNLLETT